MRTDLVFKPNAAMDVYEPSVEVDENTGNTVVSFDFTERYSGFVVAGSGTLYFTCRRALKPLSRVSGIRDNHGVPLSPHRYLYIQNTQPQFDFTGRVIAWRYTLDDNLPHNVVEQVQLLDAFPETVVVDPLSEGTH
jgi:hypothetical protein